jgi:hypothetical protein
MNISASDIPYGSNGHVQSLRTRAALKKIPKTYSCLKQKYLNVQLKYYCGYDGYCKDLKTVDKMLDIAKQNLKHFQVIMLTNDMHTSVHLLEKIMPTFFRGAVNVYENYEIDDYDAALVDQATSRRRRRSQLEPHMCSVSPPSDSDVNVNLGRSGNKRRYCACNGTVYYGRQFSEHGLLLNMEEIIASGEYVKADASTSGGMHCSHTLPSGEGGFDSDPSPNHAKQCICQPQAAEDRLDQRIGKLFHMRGSVNTRVPTRADLLPSDVKNYLRSFLKNEHLLYEEVKKHFKRNVEKCGV